MLALDSPRWSELTHAYGSADDVPDARRHVAETMPQGHHWEDEPWFFLWSALAHQGDVYPASFAAVPHVVHAVATAPDRASTVYFHFPAWVEICRQHADAEVPEDLRGAYFESLAQLPRLVAATLDRPWDYEMLHCALAAMAVGKGAVDLAEAVLELDADVTREFLAWVKER